MIKPVTYILVFLLVGVLVAIRFFENELFYDPYLTFFQNDYLYVDSPRRELFKLMAFTTWRYVLNTAVSLVILLLLFKDKGMVKFSAYIYFFAYIVLILIYLYFVVNPKQEDYYLFFNIRRFLIQPILLILLVPAFYYHKLKS
ncbi:exosortase F system-associated protein [Mariniflexile ostreae]|uniref:Exosortase F system-associated protein n=1 Tax=Mariniflexile ostreae TaxID=1520892 RepID=A0ABV5FA30_9FLAO